MSVKYECQQCLEPQADLAKEITVDLTSAIMSQHDSEVFELIEHSDFQNHQKDNIGVAPLHWAAAECRPDYIWRLMSKGADINVKDFRNQTPLFYVIDGNLDGEDLEVSQSR